MLSLVWPWLYPCQRIDAYLVMCRRVLLDLFDHLSLLSIIWATLSGLRRNLLRDVRKQHHFVNLVKRLVLVSLIAALELGLSVITVILLVLKLVWRALPLSVLLLVKVWAHLLN